MDDPVTVCQYYFEKQKYLSKAIFGTLAKPGKKGKPGKMLSQEYLVPLGQVSEGLRYSWGEPPHCHILLWLDEESTERLEDGYAISAMVPNKTDDPVLYRLVREFQVHTHKDDVCRTVHRVNRWCKQGYPQPLAARDHLNESGSLWFYRRINLRDKMVIPCNETLLKLSNSNIHVQPMTTKGILYYLCSYLTKHEPTFELADPDMKVSAIKKMLLVRNVSLPEAVANIFGHSHFGSHPTDIRAVFSESLMGSICIIAVIKSWDIFLSMTFSVIGKSIWSKNISLICDKYTYCICAPRDCTHHTDSHHRW